MKGGGMKRLCLIVLFLWISVGLFGYVVYLKDGSTYMAKKPYKVDGKYALITLQNNSVIQVELSLIDVTKTKKYNQKGITDVEVIDLGGTASGSPQGGEKRVSGLGDLATKKPGQTSLGNISVKNKGVNVREGSGTAEVKKIPFKNEALARSFSMLFENQNLFQYRLLQGKSSTSMRVEMTTDNEDEVFRTVSVIAKRLSEAVNSDRENLDRVELFMATSTGAPAGRFLITYDLAAQLAKGEITVENFFVQNVIF